jgi:hypothetical protein
MWLNSLLNPFMKYLLPHMPVQFGLMATGHTAVEDTFTAGVIGQGQDMAAPMYAADGCTPTVATSGTEDTGDKRPPAPLKGERILNKVKGFVDYLHEAFCILRPL